MGRAETALKPLRAGPEKAQRARRRVVKPQPPHAQGPRGITEPSGLGLQGDKGRRHGETQFWWGELEESPNFQAPEAFLEKKVEPGKVGQGGAGMGEVGVA